MAQTKVSLIYRALLSHTPKSKIRIIDTKMITKVAKTFGFEPKIVRQGLVRGKYILPIHFDGIYYLLDPDEFSTKFLKNRSLEIVASACTYAMGENWYYGLSSALYLNGQINQSPSEFIIITNRRQQTAFSFCETNFKIRRSSTKDYLFGIEKNGELRYSSLERTLTDYLYFDIKQSKQKYAIRICKDILQSSPNVTKKLKHKLIRIYPKPYNIAVLRAVQQVCG